MRPIVGLALGIAIGLIVECAISTEAIAQSRIALLIGNQGYGAKVGPLKNPHNDIALVGAALRSLGFKVTEIKDADYRLVDTSVNRHIQSVRREGEGAVSFVYYSGHGAANPDTKINYLIPVDVTDTDDDELWANSLNLNRIVEALREQAPSATHYVVFDACRNELNLTRKGKKALADKGFAPIAYTPGVMVAYSTAPGKTAADSGKESGPYARVLADEIVKPGLEAMYMFRRVALRVNREIGQDPWMSASTLPEIYLAGQMVPAVSTPPIPSQRATIRAVMHSDLKILDPIWTTAYIVRNHGYMIYDTLFAMDASGEIKPQMIDRYELSADKLTYTFSLRDGLLWHDGQPVTAEDCIASIKRWGAKDSMGQRLLAAVETIGAKSPRIIEMKLKEPSGLVLLALGKPSSNVPFMMPKRVAETNPNTQITDFTGSGPFEFKRDEWKPGVKTVYVKFEKYKPRSEPAYGLAGGKVVKVARVEWNAISDHAVAAKALLNGEIDLIEAPSHEHIPALKADKSINVFSSNQLGNQYTMRLNWLAKPFDNPKIRQAVWYALNQEDFLKSAFSDPSFYRVCHSYFACGTVFASEAGMDGLLTSNFAKAKELLKDAGYDGSPIVLLHPTDLQILVSLGPVAKSLLERAGFNVDMQATDWQTVVMRRARKDPPDQGGWHALTSWQVPDLLNPVMTGFFNASCDRAMFGWPCDVDMERLRDLFSREPNALRQRAIAEAIQARAVQVTTHIPLGQWFGPSAWRKDVDGIVIAPVPVFWGMSKR